MSDPIYFTDTIDAQFRCTVCGRIGTVGRCCGIDTREPLNDIARNELAAEENRKSTENKLLYSESHTALKLL